MNIPDPALIMGRGMSGLGVRRRVNVPRIVVASRLEEYRGRCACSAAIRRAGCGGLELRSWGRVICL
jgi:hypothetical protein